MKIRPQGDKRGCDQGGGTKIVFRKSFFCPGFFALTFYYLGLGWAWTRDFGLVNNVFIFV